MSFQSITLRPSDSSIVGKYSPDNNVFAICDSTDGAFSVDLPDPTNASGMFVFYNDGVNAVTVEGLALAQNEAMAFLHDDGEQEWYPLFDFYTKAEVDALIAGIVSDHGELTGLSDDDHAQYLLLAGRSGGQTANGGTAASENLTLDSTSHATKGAIVLQPSGGKVGVGVLPTESLQVAGRLRLDGNSYSIISNLVDANREVLELRGKSDAFDISGIENDCAGINLYGDADSVNPGQIIGFVSGKSNLKLLPDGGTGRFGIGAEHDPRAFVDFYSAVEHAILALSNANATDYDPQLQFRTGATGATPPAKWSFGCDSGNSYRAVLYPGDGVGGFQTFVWTVDGKFGIGIAPAQLLHLSSAGDAIALIQADSDNSGGEDDNPAVIMTQDGNRVLGAVAINGTAGVMATGALANALLLLAGTDAKGGAVQIATGGNHLSNHDLSSGDNDTIPIVAVTIDSSQRVGIGRAPTAGKLEVGGATDYSEFEADGTLVFKGDATVWEDLNFDPDRSGGPVATRPDDVTINNVFHKEFTSANNQLCGASQEIFHETMLSKTLYPHCHVFLKASETSGTTGVSFTLYWELRQHSGTTSGSVVVSATSAQLAANAHKVDLYDNTGFTGPTELGAQLAMTIKRTAGDAGDVIVTSYGIHYEIDTVGSRALTSK